MYVYNTSISNYNVNSLPLIISYQIKESIDGKWGLRNSNGTWNGMVGMVLRGVSKHVCVLT